VFSLHQIAHVGVSESTGLKRFGREIIFEEFQPLWSPYLIVTDRQMTCNLITTLCVASRGKNCLKMVLMKKVYMVLNFSDYAKHKTLGKWHFFTLLVIQFCVRCRSDSGPRSVVLFHGHIVCIIAWPVVWDVVRRQQDNGHWTPAQLWLIIHPSSVLLSRCLLVSPFGTDWQHSQQGLSADKRGNKISNEKLYSKLKNQGMYTL